jgi:hypothetical protein
MWRTIEDCIYSLLPVSRFEKKLRASTRYRHHTVRRWKRQLGLSSATANRILKNLEIIDGNKIHELIRGAVQRNPEIFLTENCYITAFGETGKSGHNIYYEFCHATPAGTRLENRWGISGLPPESRIIFVDDLIATGTQSLDHIKLKLSGAFKSSHKPCLFSVCATRRGIDYVSQNSTFDVVCAYELDEAKFNFYHENNKTFTDKEKERIRQMNERLGESAFFAMGLLLAFFYTTPDNTMPLIWNDEGRYLDRRGSLKSWFALFPRKTFTP